ncbi:Carbohydrate esterase 4 protein [Serendipita sp. 407]|nr:Carbohydrate esterase 4 protein [Serendipita sp. 407]
MRSSVLTRHSSKSLVFAPSSYVSTDIGRPPYGGIDERSASYIQSRHGKTIVLWSDDSGDSTGGTAQQSYDFYAGFANQGPSASPRMTLSHETSPAGYNAMYMGTVPRLANAGIKLVSVAQCLNADAYEVFGGFGNRDSSWYCGGSWTPSNPTPTTTTTSSTPAPTCARTYRSVQNDTCAKIENDNGLPAGSILRANPFLNCNDIWVNTPICIPPGGSTSTTTTTRTSTSTSTSTTPAPTCASTYRSVQKDTCAKIENDNGLPAGSILRANAFLNCKDIWVKTPICIPPGGSTTTRTTTTTTTTSTSTSVGPSPTCVRTYRSVQNDTCAKIENDNGLPAGSILQANQFLNCNDIWVNTPICIPPGGTGGSTCTQTISSTLGQTCDTIGADHGVSGAQILAWNTFLKCNDIWVNTPVCVKH